MSQFSNDGLGSLIALQPFMLVWYALFRMTGSSFPQGGSKVSGKVVRSHFTLEQPRDKLKALKAKSKCLRCGGTGHWAGDPECKFPKGNGGGGKPRAQMPLSQAAILMVCV